jgi:hypothetical protein
MKDTKLSREQTVAVFVIALVSFIAGIALGMNFLGQRRHWVSEPYEPTIKITIENGVRDTSYGYVLDEILEK